MSKEALPIRSTERPLGPDVVAIVVNYGTAYLALQAVESLLAHPERLAAVHLVDNASPGGDGAILAREVAARGWQDRVTLHAERVNHGFGRGNNLVLEALRLQEDRPRHVFLLNPDAQIEGNGLARLAAFLDSNPQAGAVGARLERPGQGPVPAAFRFPSPGSEILGPFGRIATRVFGVKSRALDGESGQSQVDWVSGAAVMFRFDTLCALGFFDPDFFLYYEETELMWRLRQAGHEIWFLPEARVLHLAGAATGMQDGRHLARRQPSYWYDSWRFYHLKTAGRGRTLVMALAKYAVVAGVAGLQALRRRPSRAPEGFLGDFGRFVLIPLILGGGR